jgi:formylglycine-generating enzyme required for sulfatase activity
MMRTSRAYLAAGVACLGCNPGARSHDAAPPPVEQPPVVSPAGSPEGDPSTGAADCADEPGMVYIPGGDGYVYSEDKKTYSIRPFWLDRTEVTVESFRAFVDSGRSPPWPARKDEACTWGSPDADKLPITCIDWHQAEAYCLWAGKRLPTALEWGWAAQGRDERRRYPWGDQAPSCELAIVDVDRDDAVAGCGRNGPWPVGSRPTDGARDGALDMFGNVGEWTSSGFNEEQRSSRLTKGVTWRGAPSKRLSVEEDGFYMTRSGRSDALGVRCAKDVGPKLACTK